MTETKTNYNQQGPEKRGDIFRHGGAIENILSALGPGEELLTGSSLYNFSAAELAYTGARLGIKINQTNAGSSDDLLDNITDKTRMIWLEAPSGPTLRMSDLRAISSTAQQKEITVVVDSTLAAPFLKDPAVSGADIVLHRQVPGLYGNNGKLVDAVIRKSAQNPENGGPVSPFLKSSARWFEVHGQALKRRLEKTEAVAGFLQSHPSVARVYYPGSPDHPDHTFATQFLTAPGNFISFYLADDTIDAAERIIKRSRLFVHSKEVVSSEDRISHPSQGALAHFPAYVKRRAGIRDSLLTVSIGQGTVDNLLDDLDQALKTCN